MLSIHIEAQTMLSLLIVWWLSLSLVYFAAFSCLSSTEGGRSQALVWQGIELCMYAFMYSIYVCMYVCICIDGWWLLTMRLSDRWWCLESHHTPSWYLFVIDYYHIWSTAHSAININHQCGTAGTRCHSSVSNPDVERCIELVMTYIDGHFRYYFYQILLLLLLASSSSSSSISSWHFF
jgi:hypothetical protein